MSSNPLNPTISKFSSDGRIWRVDFLEASSEIQTFLMSRQFRLESGRYVMPFNKIRMNWSAPPPLLMKIAQLSISVWGNFHTSRWVRYGQMVDACHMERARNVHSPAFRLEIIS